MVIDDIKNYYIQSLKNRQKYYGIILTSQLYHEIQYYFCKDIICYKDNDLKSIYGMPILVFDELCEKYDFDCLCVDKPTFYAMCQGKEYTEIGKKVAQELDKLESMLDYESEGTGQEAQ